MPGTISNPTTISGTDSQTFPNNLFGKAGEDIIAELHGKYYTQSYRGEMFYATTVAATAPAIYTATAVTSLSLWNPQGSGKNIVVAKAIYAPVTAVSTATMVGFALIQNAGSGVSTGGPISVTAALGVGFRGGSLLNGAGQGSSVALVSTSSTVVAPTQFIPIFGMTSDVISTSSEGTATVYDPEGTLILQPGSYIAWASAVANSGTAQFGFWWYEAPL